MKPVAKRVLVFIGVLYVITVALMITDFVIEQQPKYPDRVTGWLLESLNAVRESASSDDPEHIRSSPFTESETREIFERYFPAKGTIINLNYTLIMQCLNFGVLLMILYGFLWDPIIRFIDERRASIRRRLADAEASRSEAEDLAELRRRELGQLRSERAGILDQARRTAEQERDQIVGRAREEADRLAEQAQERIAEEVREASVLLRADVADLVAEIAETVLKREIRREDHARIIAEMADRLGGRPAAEDGGSEVV
jgi:F-type H+-transporting ATPase subunit b